MKTLSRVVQEIIEAGANTAQAEKIMCGFLRERDDEVGGYFEDEYPDYREYTEEELAEREALRAKFEEERRKEPKIFLGEILRLVNAEAMAVYPTYELPEKSCSLSEVDYCDEPRDVQLRLKMIDGKTHVYGSNLEWTMLLSEHREDLIGFLFVIDGQVIGRMRNNIWGDFTDDLQLVWHKDGICTIDGLG